MALLLAQSPPWAGPRRRPPPNCPGALLLNLGSLLTRITNGRWRSTLHRVTNPARRARDGSSPGRRLSAAFFHKPDYAALIDAAPTCLPPGGARLFEPAVAGDLTRAGLLHRFRHLPPEEASRRYHEEMARTRAAGGGGG
jgi:isopenicillin N synthase-like dioxygenase